MRRALAREQTERFEDAMADARAVLETLPSERRASELLHRCAKVMEACHTTAPEPRGADHRARCLLVEETA